MKHTFKVSIDKRIKIQQVVEKCLNLESSGYNSELIFVFYALGKRMDKNKFIYYFNLIKGVRNGK